MQRPQFGSYSDLESCSGLHVQPRYFNSGPPFPARIFSNVTFLHLSHKCFWTSIKESRILSCQQSLSLGDKAHPLMLPPAVTISCFSSRETSSAMRCASLLEGELMIANEARRRKFRSKICFRFDADSRIDNLIEIISDEATNSKFRACISANERMVIL